METRSTFPSDQDIAGRSRRHVARARLPGGSVTAEFRSGLRLVMSMGMTDADAMVCTGCRAANA